MRKLFVILPLLLMICGILGCTAEVEEKEKVETVRLLDDTSLFSMTFDGVFCWTDKETGVQYVVVKRYRELGITPRLNANGTLFVGEVTE